ncbi:YceK/YidQ family lipoprotein [Ectopseudomonas mendocina]|uniref:YceK/YidQ family lipoprotein n=1 Tax=Ectopseudomonas mendocina TaxID=300 RepID=A0ABZ2RQY0_ECTME
MIKQAAGVGLALAMLSSVSGCATVRTLDAAKVDAPVIYAGTRLDLYAMQGGCCAVDKFGAEAPKYPALDLPGSALLDTLLLPLSLATELGIGLSVSGGL